MAQQNSRIDYAGKLAAILATDRPDLEKLAAAFDGLTRLIVDDAGRAIELARAIGDHEQIIKQQIKMETMKTARQVFQLCHQRICGRGAWDESPAR